MSHAESLAHAANALITLLESDDTPISEALRDHIEVLRCAAADVLGRAETLDAVDIETQKESES